MSTEVNEELEEVQQPEVTEDEQYEKAYDDVFNAEENEAVEDEVDESPKEEPNQEEEAPKDPEELQEGDETTAEPTAEPELITLKWRGQEIKASQQEVIAMAQQNFDATHKYQEVANLKKSHQKDMDLLHKAQAGDKQAIAQIIGQGKVDPIDLLDVEIPEQGTQNQEEPFVSPQVEELLSQVSKEPELFNALQETEKDLPQSVVDKMAKDPETFYSIVTEVRTGDAKIVMPEVQKHIAMMNEFDRSVVTGNPDAFANLYVNVKNNLIQKLKQAQQAPQQRSQQPQKQKTNVNELSVRKSGQSKRRGAEKADSFNDDNAYQAILDRLESQ